LAIIPEKEISGIFKNILIHNEIPRNSTDDVYIRPRQLKGLSIIICTEKYLKENLYQTQFCFLPYKYSKDESVFFLLKFNFIQGGPEKILLKTRDSFVVNSNFCEPPCISIKIINLKRNIEKVKLKNFSPADYFLMKQLVRGKLKYLSIVSNIMRLTANINLNIEEKP